MRREVFSRRRGRLFCEGVDLELIARKEGTPVYVYSRRFLRDRFSELDEAWKGYPHLICYSVKANSNLAVIRTLAQAGAGLDVVSGGELRRGLKAGARGEKIVFAGVGKTREEIAAGLRAGVLYFTVESLPELEEIDREAAGRGIPAPVAFRVNPDVDARTHRFITTGKKENKFGLDMEQVREAFRRCRRLEHVKPVGLQMHIGSQITSVRPFVQALKRLLLLYREAAGEGFKLDYLDVGGGMGISYDGRPVPSARDWARALAPPLQGCPATVVLEPGRWLVGGGGVLLTRVIYLKRKEKKNFVIVDAGMNDLVRPALYGAFHRIEPVRLRRGEKIRADIVGPVCESGDYLGMDRPLPAPRPGELLAVMEAGAYGFAMSSNYNSRPRPPEVMVSGNGYRVIRKRESISDLWRGEVLPDFSGH